MAIAVGLSVYALVAHIVLWRRYLPGWTDTLVAAFVLSVGQIIASELLLGLVHLLRPAPLIAANVLLSTLLLGLGHRRVVTGIEFWARFRDLARVLLRSPVSVGIALLLLFVLGSILWLVWVLPENSYDGLAYHLPIALSRLDRADMSRLIGWPPWISSYPQYSELLMLWTVIFDRRLTWVDGVQWPFWVIGIIAVYGLARKLGAAPNAAFQGCTVFAFAPLFALQSRTAYNDVMVAALFLTALNILLVRKGVLSAFIAGLAVSLIAGIKYPGVLYPLFVGLGLLVLDWLTKGSEGLHWIDWQRLLVFIAPVVLLAAPWYLGNWLTYGNPFWPFTIGIKDRTLFEGMFTLDELYADNLRPEHRGLSWLILNPYIWLEPTSLYSPDDRYSGLGVLWVVLGLPALVYALLTLPRNQRHLLLWLCIVAGGLYFTIPHNYWPRYVAFLPGLGAVGVALALHHASLWIRRFAQSLLLPGAAFSLLAIVAATASPQTTVNYARLPAAERPTLGLLDWPAYRWLGCNTYSGTGVAYGYGLYFIAPLWGDDIHNRVVYAGNSEQALATAVTENSTRFVFIERHPENAWIDSVPYLMKIYEDERFSIYSTASEEP